MARVLIGWELGSNRGHLARMLRFHDALVAAGHHVALAVQRIDGIAGEARRIPGRIWQAPVWPRLLAWAARPVAETPATLGDILARLGLGEPGALAALIEAWDGILDAARPDVVIGEYAPALLLAARARMPTIAIGIGFDLPPAHMAAFPSFTGGPPLADEAALLATTNADLAAVGRPALSALPALFAADRPLLSGLTALDPYAAERGDAAGPPLLDIDRQPPPAEADELFVYWPERAPPVAALWQALATSGLPVRIHIPRLGAGDAATLSGAGFTVEPAPVPFADIARRSRLLLSHGGAGFVSHGLATGRPQVVVHFDLEKRHNGLTIDAMGLGAQMPAGDFDAPAFAHGLRLLHADAAMATRAADWAADWWRGHDETAEARLVRTVEELAA